MINTSDFKYFQWDFNCFNPVQEAAYPFFATDSNLIISSSMASGKTTIAEAVMAYELTRGYVAYVCPLKALLVQQGESWKNTVLGERGISVFSSDENTLDVDIKPFIMATIESLDIKVRKKVEWIKKLKCFVFDEAHLIGHIKRGSDSEALIMGLSELNKDCRIIFLSGTLGNAEQISKWLKNLNGKDTKFINSNWTPCKIRKTICISDDNEKTYQKIKGVIKANPYHKNLIFVHSKKYGEAICKRLCSEGVRCVFYYADLDIQKKRKMVEAFKDNYNSLSTMVTTSSLGMGINL